MNILYLNNLKYVIDSMSESELQWRLYNDPTFITLKNFYQSPIIPPLKIKIKEIINKYIETI